MSSPLRHLQSCHMRGASRERLFGECCHSRITHCPLIALPPSFLPLARLSPSDQHGAAITGTGALERFTHPSGPAIPHGDRIMRAGVLACQSEAVAISTSANGRGALTVVATDRADVLLASAVGSAAAPVLVWHWRPTGSGWWRWRPTRSRWWRWRSNQPSETCGETCKETRNETFGKTWETACAPAS